MSRSIVEIEAQRARWARYRRRQRLHLEAGEDFAHGGLGRHIDNLDVRLLFVPADPEADVVPLGSETLEWLREDREVPCQGRPPTWSSDRAVADALVLFDYYRDQTDWVRYLAIHRHGGIEVGATHHTYEVQETRILSLRHVVGLVWIAAGLQQEAIERWKLSAPYELTLGVINTRGAALGGFAEGWREIGQGLHGFSTCLDDHVLLRWELDEIETENIAMGAGDRLEQAFGTTHRRHIANRGEYADRFDPRFGY
jgi:hypothetical protein